MQLLYQSPFLRALGWALLNSLWQFGILWLLFLWFAPAKRFAPRTRHAIALLCLSSGFAWFLVSLWSRFLNDDPAFISAAPDRYTAGAPSLVNVVNTFIENNIPYVSAIYLLVMAALLIKFSRYFYYAHRLRTTGLTRVKPELRLFVEQLARKLDIRNVSVWLSQQVDTPVIVGFLRPTILLPVACMNQLSVKQVEAILLHELAHISRNDYLINLSIALFEIVFFFNPFTRLFIATIRQERENCCDDYVLQFRYDRHQYASALLCLEKNRGAYVSLAVASTGAGAKTLLRRVQRIMQVKRKDTANRYQSLACLGAVILLSTVAFLQPRSVAPAGDEAMLLSGITPARYDFVEMNTKEAIKTIVSAADSVRIIEVLPQAIPQPSETENEPGSTPVEQEMADADLEAVLLKLASHRQDQTAQVVVTVKKGTSVFSKQDALVPAFPEAVYAHPFPFVPSSSFSYIAIDTSKPLIKPDSYPERDARESLMKAKKALEVINWSEIERKLANRENVAAIRKALEDCLNTLNWQQLNDDVRREIAVESQEKLRKHLEAEADALNQYREHQYLLQQVQAQIDQQREAYKREISRQTLAIQKELERQQAMEQADQHVELKKNQPKKQSSGKQQIISRRIVVI